jgi:hypothetical protein
VSGHQAILKQGYHLTHFLDDFLKYYSKAPNFARNLVHAGNILNCYDGVLKSFQTELIMK